MSDGNKISFDKINLSGMNTGDKASGYVLLHSVEEKQGANGPYCVLTISDGNTTENAKMWKMSLAEFRAEPKTVIGVQIECGEYNGKKDYTIRNCGPAKGTDLGLTDFIEKAPLNPEDMYGEILEILKSSVGVDYKNTLAGLTEYIYELNKEKLLYWSAAENVHHNMYAGLLYHTYRMMQQAKVLVQVYPSLDAEVLMSGVALHDIGKLEEMVTDDLGKATYTVDGHLFGHAMIGIQMISDAATHGDYSEEKIRCLKHCIASHHGKQEWGAIVLPQIEEAAVLHYIDMIDSRIQQYEKCYESIEPGCESASPVFGLERVKVYKPEYKK